MYIDYKDINKARPKDAYPLPTILQVLFNILFLT